MTLRTYGWTIINGKREYREFLVDLDKVLYATAHADPSGDNTCLLALTTTLGLHVDVPLSKMQEIIRESKIHPLKDFDTHPDFDKDKPSTQKPPKSWKKKSSQ